jgi:hypothetical protein
MDIKLAGSEQRNKELAKHEFNRASRQAMWNAVTSWISGSSNELLSYEAVRKALPIEGQNYLGLKKVDLEHIVGSVGRYRDFDRAFRPKGAHTSDRWMRVEMAWNDNIGLPPVNLYKVGEAYFVQDGNHRVSIARLHDGDFIDAYVTEIRVPVNITPEDTVETLSVRQENADLLETSNILELRPDADLEITLPGECGRVLEHIEGHQEDLASQSKDDIAYPAAVASWYDSIYLPTISQIKTEELADKFPDLTLTDLYVIVSEYQWLLQDAYGQNLQADAARQKFNQAFPEWSAGKVIKKLGHAAWLDQLILSQERQAFEERTALIDSVQLTLPGKYEFILGQIRAHRWQLQEEEGEPTSFESAAQSWYDAVYCPLVELIDSHDLLENFPDREAGDLYYWIVDRKDELAKQLGWELSPQTMLRQVTENTVHPGSELEFCKDILVSIGTNPADWRALDQAISIARRSEGRVHGLHVFQDEDSASEVTKAALMQQFTEHCQAGGVHGELAFEIGGISQAINARARWVELIVIPLNHRPQTAGVFQIGSGIRRIIRRAGRPVLVIPEAISPIEHVMLAYDASPKSCQAMYLVDQMMESWQTETCVISVDNADALETAEAYLASHGHEIKAIAATGAVSEAILEHAAREKSDVIAVGGFGHAAVFDFVWGSTVDALLRNSPIPLLILA